MRQEGRLERPALLEAPRQQHRQARLQVLGVGERRDLQHLAAQRPQHVPARKRRLQAVLAPVEQRLARRCPLDQQHAERTNGRRLALAVDELAKPAYRWMQPLGQERQQHAARIAGQHAGLVGGIGPVVGWMDAEGVPLRLQDAAQLRGPHRGRPGHDDGVDGRIGQDLLQVADDARPSERPGNVGGKGDRDGGHAVPARGHEGQGEVDAVGMVARERDTHSSASLRASCGARCRSGAGPLRAARASARRAAPGPRPWRRRP